MAELTDEQKREIVKRLACFEGLTEIVKAFREEYEVELTARHVGLYDPTRGYFEAGDQWRTLFEETRKAYVEDAAAVPCANQGFRLNLLQKGIDAAVKNNNWKLAAELTEQAAREVGGVLTNERRLKIDRGLARDMSPEDRASLLASVLNEALDKRLAPQQPTKH